MQITAKEEIGEWRKLAGNGDWEGIEALAGEVIGRGTIGRLGEMEKEDDATSRLRDSEIKRLRKKGVPLPPVKNNQIFMATVGRYNKLKVLRETSSGYFLDGEELGDILLPGKYAPKGMKEGEEIEVFLYFDSEDRLIATTEEPYCEVGDFVLLEIVEVNAVGAFLNWGLQKDLLVPFREQKVKMEPGSWHVVHVYLDEQTNRIAASAKVDKFLDKEPATYKPGDEVELFIYGPCPLGYNAIINNSHWGMLYSGEVFQPLNRGEHITGYINKVREDGKIDLNLYPAGYKKASTSAELIVEYLKRKNGFMPLTDKSPADEIYETFGISKKNFKMAVGSLYKSRVIEIGQNGIRLAE